MPAEAKASHGNGGAALRWGKRILIVVVLGLAGFLLHRALAGQDPAQLAERLRSVAPGRIAAACAFSLGSYACLTLFDFLALIYVGKRLSYPRVALASFTSLSLGHNLGLAAVSSGAIRYRFYSRWGLSAVDVAKVILFCGMTVGIGLSVLAALALSFQPELATRMTGLSSFQLRLVAIGIVVALCVYLTACTFVTRSVLLWGQRVKLPDLRLALAQVVVGTVNFALVAGCLQQSLAVDLAAPYPDVAAAYILANFATLISHVPGGLGVIETVVGQLFGVGKVVVGLILFRLVYFIGPLLAGAMLLALSELLFARRGTAATGPNRAAVEAD
jgi:uncharacterized membrane protein YbhN (UPF0104 family)